MKRLRVKLKYQESDDSGEQWRNTDLYVPIKASFTVTLCHSETIEKT